VERSVVSIQRGPDVVRTVKTALELQGGLKRLVRRGADVLIKPNYGVPISWQMGATTHPEVVVALIEAAAAAGAGRIVVAESAVVGFDAGRVMAELGVVEPFEQAGATVVNLDADQKDCVVRRIAGGRLHKQIRIFRQVLDCDVLISVPVLKTHIYTTVSLGMKNLKGTLPDSQKKRLHRIGCGKDGGEAFELDRGIAEMMTVHSPDLTVIDAVVGQEGFVQNAGVCGSPVRMDSVIVGTDFVAADAVGAHLMGFDPSAVNHIRYCHEMGLGEADLACIKIVGENPAAVRRSFRPARPGELAGLAQIEVREGGACSGCSVAIRCALNSFAPESLQEWKPSLVFVGAAPDTTAAPSDKRVYVGNCACRLAGRGDIKIGGCPPPFSYTARKLNQALGV